MATERAFPATPIPFAGGRAIASPFQFVTTGEDNLRIISINAAGGITLGVHLRRLSDRGEIDPATFVHVPNSDRTAKTQDYLLGIGALLNLTVFATAGAPRIGQTFVIVQLIRGTGAVAVLLGTLLQGYVTSTQALGWPGSPIQSSLDGGGYHRAITGTAPAVFAQIIETVPTGARWELLAVRFSLTTSAAAGTRIVFMNYHGAGGTAFGNVAATATQAASLTYGYSFTGNWTRSGGTDPPNNVFGGLPTGIILLAGWDFNFQASGMDANDHFSAPVYEVREWLEGD